MLKSIEMRLQHAVEIGDQEFGGYRVVIAEKSK